MSYKHVLFQGQTLPQYDGVHDEIPTSTPDSTEQDCSSHDTESICSGACGSCEQQSVGIEFEASRALSKKLAKDIKRSIKNRVPQIDGNHDTSSSEDDDYDDDDGDGDDDDKEEGDEEGEEEVRV